MNGGSWIYHDRYGLHKNQRLSTRPDTSDCACGCTTDSSDAPMANCSTNSCERENFCSSFRRRFLTVLTSGAWRRTCQTPAPNLHMNTRALHHHSGCHTKHLTTKPHQHHAHHRYCIDRQNYDWMVINTSHGYKKANHEQHSLSTTTSLRESRLERVAIRWGDPVRRRDLCREFGQYRMVRDG